MQTTASRFRKLKPLAEVLHVSPIALIESLLAEATERNASDIHIDPERTAIRIRMRIDGILVQSRVLERGMHAAILARIKVLAGLRTDEHAAAQDGRFKFMDADGGDHDVRVSIAPTYHGENAVLRILTQRPGTLSLRELGCRKSHELMLTRALERSHGMILVTGPTGSGKTTLLYSLLQRLDSATRSIVTLEDPVEYSLEGITQIPVHAEGGMTFGNGLRSVLRQDPDVLMVGEIRDGDTARLATNAALTGHLVLSSLHTNDAVAALPRLFDLGIDPYLVAATVRLVAAQRLVRRVCADCKVPSAPKERHLEHLRVGALKSTESFVTGAGCDVCLGTGYRGRLALFELLAIDDAMQHAILSGSAPGEMRAVAEARGMRSLAEDGVEKARKGMTTIDEVFRACYA